MVTELSLRGYLRVTPPVTLALHSTPHRANHKKIVAHWQLFAPRAPAMGCLQGQLSYGAPSFGGALLSAGVSSSGDKATVVMRLPDISTTLSWVLLTVVTAPTSHCSPNLVLSNCSRVSEFSSSSSIP